MKLFLYLNIIPSPTMELINIIPPNNHLCHFRFLCFSEREPSWSLPFVEDSSAESFFTVLSVELDWAGEGFFSVVVGFGFYFLVLIYNFIKFVEDFI